MCAAIVRTVRRGTPGTLFDHNSIGKFSMRYVVTRWFVRHAAINASPSNEFVISYLPLAISDLPPNGNLIVTFLREAPMV